MKAKEFYNKRAFKHQLRRAIKHDKQYFEDTIIELMEMYTQEQVKKLTIPDVSQRSELLAFRKWQKDNWKDVYLYSDEFMVSEFKKANCG